MCPSERIFYPMPHPNKLHRTMNPNEINRRIATACGCFEKAPNYHGDLNAMHEAEQTLEPLINRLKFPEVLAQVVSKQEGFRANGIPLPEWHRVHATAAQRAEAFLKTIGQWEDGK
jgi:hypothetical protein